MDRVENRRHGDGTLNNARHRAAVIRRRGGHGGGFVSEAAYSGEMPRTTARRVEAQRSEEGPMKRFFKSVFLNVHGDVNEIG